MDPLSSKLDDLLGDAPEAFRVAAAVAEAGGCRLVGRLEGALRHVDAADRPFLLVPVAHELPADPRGAPGDVDRLVSAVGQALGGWRFEMHLRRALPPGFDPSGVGRAVQLWRLAVERGEWRGRHAVYEDEAVAIDITLVGDRTSAGNPGPLAVIPPLDASDRLAGIYRELLAVLHAHEATGQPLVVALVAPRPWRLPRGHLLEMLYGPADEVLASHDDGGSRAMFTWRRSGLSLFSDPLCRHLAAMWWLEPGGAPGAVRGQAHVNPWSEHPPDLARFPGRRLEPLDPALAPRPLFDRKAAVLAFSDDPMEVRP